MTAVVLMYHRVADAGGADPYGLAVSRASFVEHVELLTRRGDAAPLADVRSNNRAARVVITFDDGYVDNALVAAPLLVEAGLPATFFVTTARIGGQHFWWDRLAAAVLHTPDLPDAVDVDVGGRPVWLHLASEHDRLTALHFLHRRLRPLPPDELEDQVQALVDLTGSAGPPADATSMSVEQLRALAELPGVDVGAHTRTHLQLKDQSASLQREEITGSVEDLVELLRRPVQHFAYPFGSASAIGALAPTLVAEAGCSLACSTSPGAVTAESSSLLLPRLNVENWTGAELGVRIDRLMQGGRSA